MLIRSRRDFLKDSLRSASALGALGMLSKFGHMNALAQSSQSGYQALVCIYLAGGNDGHNTVIPISTALQNYSQYQKSRPPLAIAQNQLRPIMNGSDQYGLHPAMPEIAALYNQGSAAVLANVGNLVTPITRAIYQSNNLSMLPNALFSHSDQSNQWQSAIPNGIATSGWGGRIADLVQSQNSGAIFPPISSIAGCGLFCTGQQTFPASVPPPYSGQTAGTSMSLLNGILDAPSTATGMQQLLTFSNGLQLVQAGNATLSRGNDYANTLTGLLQTPTLTTVFPTANGLAAQLQTVANVMSVRSQLGLTRQIFFCTVGSFDTHGNQSGTQYTLLGQVSKAINAFYQATQEMGIEQNVTTFTASEFGRTLNPSGNDGSDHAWGSHHFVVGGGVQGGKFYGTFPDLVLGGSDDASSRGVLIPSTGIAQYGATMAQWFGVPASNLVNVFPNIGNFTTPTLGFLG
jgi:uncharacterized protein (DUF1501 family)